MSRLQDALRRVTEERYRDQNGRPSYRQAAEACQLSPNMISNYVSAKRPPLPTLDTLDKYAVTFGWPLCEVVYWALDREPPVPGGYDPVQEMYRAWRHLGLTEDMQGALWTIIGPSVRAVAPPRNAHSQ